MPFNSSPRGFLLPDPSQKRNPTARTVLVPLPCFLNASGANPSPRSGRTGTVPGELRQPGFPLAGTQHPARTRTRSKLALNPFRLGRNPFNKNNTGFGEARKGAEQLLPQPRSCLCPSAAREAAGAEPPESPGAELGLGSATARGCVVRGGRRKLSKRERERSRDKPAPRPSPSPNHACQQPVRTPARQGG